MPFPLNLSGVFLLVGVALLVLAAYGAIRLIVELVQNGDWVWLALFVATMVGLALFDLRRARRLRSRQNAHADS